MQLCKRGAALLLSLVLVFTGWSVVSVAAESIPAVKDEAGYYVAPTNLPALYINLSNGVQQEEINQDVWIAGGASMVNTGGYDLTNVAVSMKGRGNYSWSAPKKPYSIKFDKKQNVLGMGKAKKWVLIANYWDKTMLRNYTTMMLAMEMGMPYTTECAFVDLYINGIYRGNYLLTEKVEIKEERIEIDPDQGGVLFEIEQAYRHNGVCDYCHEVASGTHLTYKEPELEDDYTVGENGATLTEADLQAIMARMNPWLDEMDTSLYQGFDVYSQYIDVQSFVDWYIVNEFVNNYDSQFVTSCYCYYDNTDQKLHMGPVWDYDTCYGNQSASGYGTPSGWLIQTGAPWFRILMQDETFSNLVKERWTSLKKNGTIANILNNAMAAAQLIDQSQALNFQAWPNMLTDNGPRESSMAFQTWKQEVDYLRDWIVERTLWLDEQWNTEINAAWNQMDNLNMITKGMLLDSSYSVSETYFTQAYTIYAGLSPEEQAQLDPEVQEMLANRSVYLAESAIRAAAAATSFSQRGTVAYARKLFDALSPENQALVTNYQALLTAEDLMIQLAIETGVSEVFASDVTGYVDLTSLVGTAGFYGENFENLFDDNTSTKWCVTMSPTGAEIQWKMQEPMQISCYAIATANDSPERNPESWIFYGSENGVDWSVIHQVEQGNLPQEFFTYQGFTVSNPGVYSYYKIVFTGNVHGNSGILQMSELMLGGAVMERVDAVIAAISALNTEITLSDREAVEVARAAYEALSVSEKKYVTNYDRLYQAEVAIARLDGVDDAIQAVMDAIDEIGTPVALRDGAAIRQARSLYNGLKEAKRVLVENYETLTAAESRLSALQAASQSYSGAKGVSAAIDAIGTVTETSGEAIFQARSAYIALTEEQKAYVTNLDVLVSAELTFAGLFQPAAVSTMIADIPDTITYHDGPQICAARSGYDALTDAQKAQVANLSRLTAAEQRLQEIYDAFQVTVISNSERSVFSNSPWMNFDQLSAQELDATLAAMSQEYLYQYRMGYAQGMTNGVYQNSSHDGLLISQNDVYIVSGNYSATENNDNVGNPWGSSGRYWSCTIAPFPGMAFSVNGYLSTADLYQGTAPLTNSFTYDGYVYQVYTSGTISYQETALVRDGTVGFIRSDFAPGSGDAENHNTFAYAYAKYNQDNKEAGLVVGVPTGNVTVTADGTVKYQTFVSENGVAYILGRTEDIYSADVAAGTADVATVLSGAIAKAFADLGATVEESLAITGMPTGDPFSSGSMVLQSFENGTLAVLSNGVSVFYPGTYTGDNSFLIANAENLIDAIGTVSLTSAPAILAAGLAYAGLMPEYQEQVSNQPILAAAEVELEQLLTMLANAQTVDAAILQLNSTSSEEDIAAAEQAYLALSDTEQDMVEYYDRLQMLLAGEEPPSLEIEPATQAVIDAIAALPEVADMSENFLPAVGAARDAYLALSAEQKVYVINLQKLEALEAWTPATPPSQPSTEILPETQAVIDAIAALPTLEQMSLEALEAVRNARFAYDALPVEQKELVTNLQMLETLEAWTPLYGDLNGDGKLSVTDVVLLRKVILQGGNSAIGDMNLDGSLSVTDVVLLRKAILN